MYKVDWAPSDFSTIVTRWFHGRDAAIRFARTRYVAVVYDPDGNRIKNWEALTPREVRGVQIAIRRIQNAIARSRGFRNYAEMTEYVE